MEIKGKISLTVKKKNNVRISQIHKDMAVYMSGYGGYPYAREIDYTKGNYRIVRDFAYYKGEFEEYLPSCNLLYYKGKLICKTIADSYDERVSIMFSTDAEKAQKQMEEFIKYHGGEERIVVPEAFINARIGELDARDKKARDGVRLATWRTTRGYYKGRD